MAGGDEDTTEEVWQAILSLARPPNLTVGDNVYAADFRIWEQARFVRTTIDSRGFDDLRQFPDADFGFRAGLAVPLRIRDPGQAPLIRLGSDFSRAEFDALLAEYGWTLHAAMLSAHARYTELIKLEFTARNQLTEKRKEMLWLVGQGLMDKQIANQLGIFFSAVRQRLSTVQTKTGAQNRADLAALAARLGLVSDPLLRGHRDDLTVFPCTGDGKTGTVVRRLGNCPSAAAEQGLPRPTQVLGGALRNTGGGVANFPLAPPGGRG